MSDHHNAIIGAMREVFGGECHAYCYRHIKENFSTQSSKAIKGGRRKCKEDAMRLLDAIAYARLDFEYMKALQNLSNFSPDLAKWVENESDVDKWALSRFPHR